MLILPSCRKGRKSIRNGKELLHFTWTWQRPFLLYWCHVTLKSAKKYNTFAIPPSSSLRRSFTLFRSTVPPLRIPDSYASIYDMVPFDLKIHAITLAFAQSDIHAWKVEYMSLTFKYKSMKFNIIEGISQRCHFWVKQQPQHHQGGCFQDGNLRILESILPSISLCKNLEIVIFKLISQA